MFVFNTFCHRPRTALKRNIDRKFDFYKVEIYFGKVCGKILEVYLVVVVVVIKIIIERISNTCLLR